ncbi:MAG: nuclease-related domain-containing protein, partial [Pseudanabaena sp.]
MIVKELDRLEPSDKFEQAGYYAESQLAFYLKREFKDDPQFLIFNNLRLVKADDVCQIDHLVLHRYGMIIIESKSVTTRVEVNEHGEWKRWFNNAWQGMPSPILQAQR